MLSVQFSHANNIQIANIDLVGNNLNFMVSWENSWNINSLAPFNRDAVWLVFKMRDVKGVWRNLKISKDSSQVQILGGEKVNFEWSKFESGCLIYRSKLGGGTTSSTISIPIIENSISDISEILIHGIEMVKINTGAYYLGDSMSINRLGVMPDYHPLWVNSEYEISVGMNNGQLSAHYDNTIPNTQNSVPASNIPLAYPKGFEAFYCMKYEISQEQYCSFLNTLTLTQQQSRMGIPAFKQERYSFYNGAAQNGIGANTLVSPWVFYCDLNPNNPINALDDGQSKACNFINWLDLAAYLDWAGLRPMDEMEYEKICRGSEMYQPSEYAWGNKNIIDANKTALNGSENEKVEDTIKTNFGIANHGTYNPSYDNTALRCGFAATATTDRLTAGSSYFGVMEMTGNLWEQCINLSVEGIKFLGTHGDGILDDNGNATNIDWSPTTAKGSGTKGGGWNSGIQLPYNDGAVSDRFYCYQNQMLRRNTVGGRGVLKL